MILTDASHLYNYFLDIIRRENSPAVPPARGIRLLNEGAQTWLEENAPKEGQTQTSDDMLQEFYEVVILDTPFAIPNDYFRALKVRVRIITDDECITHEEINGVNISTDYLKTKKYRPDEQTDSYYRMPNVKRLYYHINNNVIDLYGGTPYRFQLQYIKKFVEITNVTTTPNDLSAYNNLTLKDIANTTARIHLERVESMRMQSHFQMEMVNKQLKN
jgi:hypothetical protein